MIIGKNLLILLFLALSYINEIVGENAEDTISVRDVQPAVHKSNTADLKKMIFSKRLELKKLNLPFKWGKRSEPRLDDEEISANLKEICTKIFKMLLNKPLEDFYKIKEADVKKIYSSCSSVMDHKVNSEENQYEDGEQYYQYDGSNLNKRNNTA